MSYNDYSKKQNKSEKKSFNLINNSNEDLSKPEKKFLQEMIMGMILSGSCNLTEISYTLKDDIYIKRQQE